MISVITPVLNGEKYIEQCIDSVLNQKGSVEHIIVDGGSTDATIAILEKYHKLYPDRVIYRSAKDKGVGDAWNWGIIHSRGDILSWLGYDDLLTPEAIFKVVNFFNSNPQTVFVYGEADIIDTSCKVTGSYTTEKFNYTRLLNNGLFILLASSFYKREIFDTCGFNQDYGSDYDFFCRVGAKYPLCYMEGEVLSQYRLHTGNVNRNPGLHSIRRVYQISRKYGGKRLSVWGKIYYTSMFSEPLRPVLGWSYPVLGKMFKAIHYSPIKHIKT